MSKKTEFNFEWPPSLNTMYLNMRGRGRVASPCYRKWREAADAAFNMGRRKAMTGPVSISYTFGKKKGRFDLSNFVKPIEDALVRNGVLTDDNSAVIREFNVKYDPSLDGVQVTITTL